MIDKNHKIHIFARIDNNNKYFTYLGLGLAKKVENTEPVTVYWEFDSNLEESYIQDEITINKKYTEGALKKIYVNKYERNEKARKDCIKHYGCKCIICGMDFLDKYGAAGHEFIHVHHLIQLSDINQEYVVDPIEDLRPVCPNCHAIIHRKEVPYTIEEMKEMIKKNSTTKKLNR